jgi:hypothetical protein
MTIGFIHPHKAFLPELIAYVDFFSARGIITRVMSTAELPGSECDVEWHFMGQQTRRHKDRITIHEYASASVPPFSTLKDGIKKFINTTPDYRLFLNEYVRKAFNFHDHIPFGYRDMGIPEQWLKTEPFLHERNYDFVYVGTVEKSRRPELLLDRFATGALQAHTLLVLTRNYEELGEAYAGASNITFKGPIPYNEVYAQIQQARFGINYMPDIVPYNQQTSAKFIDYAACHLPVVTTDYAWVHNFQNRFGGNYFYLQPDWSNFTWENVQNFPYSLPDLSSWTWEKQIRSSGVVEFLQSTFPELKL